MCIYSNDSVVDGYWHIPSHKQIENLCESIHSFGIIQVDVDTDDDDDDYDYDDDTVSINESWMLLGGGGSKWEIHNPTCISSNHDYQTVIDWIWLQFNGAPENS